MRIENGFTYGSSSSSSSYSTSSYSSSSYSGSNSGVMCYDVFGGINTLNNTYNYSSNEFYLSNYITVNSSASCCLPDGPIVFSIK